MVAAKIRSIAMKQVRGFSLIELMVVIAILGIMTAVALPDYRDYSVKAKLSKGVYYLSECRKKLENYYHEYDEFPRKVCGLTNGVTSTEKIEGFTHIKYAKWPSGLHASISASFDENTVKEVKESGPDTGAIYLQVHYDKNTESFITKCGRLNSSQIPASYLPLLPTNCRDDNIAGAAQ